jgi:hypothetical protein
MRAPHLSIVEVAHLRVVEVRHLMRGGGRGQWVCVCGCLRGVWVVVSTFFFDDMARGPASRRF